MNRTLAEQKKYAEQRNIEFTAITDFAFDIALRADKQKIKTLLSNILKSTIDYSGATSIVINVRQLLRSEKEILLELSLEDNGPLARSEKRFSYLRSLIANRSAIEELKGKSEFVTSHDSGNILKFILSCAFVEENDVFASGLKFLNGKKILVVDDNEINRIDVAGVLESAGFECTAVSNGIKAIDLLEKSNSYDLILLDLLMPQMDGFETAAYIRKRLKNSTPIIAMPARNKMWIPVMCKEAGIDNILAKPFAANKLLNTINCMLKPVMSNTAPVLIKTA